MKTLKILALILFIGFSSCKPAPTSENVKALATTEFKESLEKEPGVILDVRPKRMYAEDHIESAVSLDFGDANFKEELAKLDKNKPVYVYCNAGHRSGKTAKILDEMGFKKVVDLKDGLNDWKAKKLPVVTKAKE